MVFSLGQFASICHHLNVKKDPKNCLAACCDIFKNVAGDAVNIEPGYLVAW